MMSDSNPLSMGWDTKLKCYSNHEGLRTTTKFIEDGC